MINYLQAVKLYFKCNNKKPKIVKKDTAEYNEIMKIKNSTSCPNNLNSKNCKCIK
jgi:hypothetical protein